MNRHGELGHDERMMFCLDCDTKTRHILRVLKCSTEQATCCGCGKIN